MLTFCLCRLLSFLRYNIVFSIISIKFCSHIFHMMYKKAFLILNYITAEIACGIAEPHQFYGNNKIDAVPAPSLQCSL
jgi:hypothetical protein